MGLEETTIKELNRITGDLQGKIGTLSKEIKERMLFMFTNRINPGEPVLKLDLRLLQAARDIKPIGESTESEDYFKGLTHLASYLLIYGVNQNLEKIVNYIERFKPTISEIYDPDDNKQKSAEMQNQSEKKSLLTLAENAIGELTNNFSEESLEKFGTEIAEKREFAYVMLEILSKEFREFMETDAYKYMKNMFVLNQINSEFYSVPLFLRDAREALDLGNIVLEDKEIYSDKEVMQVIGLTHQRVLSCKNYVQMALESLNTLYPKLKEIKNNYFESSPQGLEERAQMELNKAIHFFSKVDMSDYIKVAFPDTPVHQFFSGLDLLGEKLSKETENVLAHAGKSTVIKQLKDLYEYYIGKFLKRKTSPVASFRSLDGKIYQISHLEKESLDQMFVQFLDPQMKVKFPINYSDSEIYLLDQIKKSISNSIELYAEKSKQIIFENEKPTIDASSFDGPYGEKGPERLKLKTRKFDYTPGNEVIRRLCEPKENGYRLVRPREYNERAQSTNPINPELPAYDLAEELQRIIDEKINIKFRFKDGSSKKLLGFTSSNPRFQNFVEGGEPIDFEDYGYGLINLFMGLTVYDQEIFPFFKIFKSFREEVLQHTVDTIVDNYKIEESEKERLRESIEYSGLVMSVLYTSSDIARIDNPNIDYEKRSILWMAQGIELANKLQEEKLKTAFIDSLKHRKPEGSLLDYL